MNLIKPKFWDKKFSLLSLLLIPLSLVYQSILIIRNLFIKEKSFDIPIICVGNIYLGGTGKTPLSIEIFKILRENSKTPCIVKKYYKKQSDEHKLIHQTTKSFVLGKTRLQAINFAKEKNFKSIILDDGYQDKSIKKNLNIICFNSSQSIGNNLVIPAGPLRESLKALDRSQIVVINGKKNVELEKKILFIRKEMSIYYSKYRPCNLEKFENLKLLAFAGIGNPENFFSLCKENNLDLRKTLSFPDHYNFKKKEIDKINDYAIQNDLSIITTHKDYLRIQDFGFKNINYLETTLEIHQKEKFVNQLLSYL